MMQDEHDATIKSAVQANEEFKMAKVKIEEPKQNWAAACGEISNSLGHMITTEVIACEDEAAAVEKMLEMYVDLEHEMKVTGSRHWNGYGIFAETRCDGERVEWETYDLEDLITDEEEAIRFPPMNTDNGFLED